MSSREFPFHTEVTSNQKTYTHNKVNPTSNTSPNTISPNSTSHNKSQSDNVKTIHQDNAIMNFLNNKLHGECTYYDKKGNLLQRAFYKEDMLHGPMEIFEKGIISSITHYENDKKNGAEIVFSTETYLPERMQFYQNDELHGPSIVYNEIGSIAMYQMHTHGLRNGICQIYNQNGMLVEQYTYVKDKKDGVHKKYHSSGAVFSVELFQNGISLYPAKHYDEKGNEIMLKK